MTSLTCTTGRTWQFTVQNYVTYYGLLATLLMQLEPLLLLHASDADWRPREQAHRLAVGYP
ncbi:uncharacterized protein BDR25DRAFT_350442 [Lindgomyces ingoldianus]|uniref:Uncharacterized protein n=1 Tax=Lindgomyces ingoldianus TaxID=673940 RepID=A0ACB6RA86_9PLEO|nr:uncharacterized protein BDR25DRAFT_350442 [Lindgomyces ingoldianus]KAF2476154.1 hypothetical protein BDR25DRAFT_350442 [Lindgomyces ingoldianus]